MNKIVAIVILFSCPFTTAIAQQSLKGVVLDGGGKPLKYATISLLQTADSTLKFFGISKESGIVEVKNVKPGDYLLQAAMLGYKTYYKHIQVSANNDDMGAIVMDKQDMQMKGVEVKAERIPVLINKDTIEYDAGAFKTKADASVEELLKKLPGVEVDRAGNIKAQGENVGKVLVDGKEFFGSDPKVATRNLPADAINKVQVFDKMSDQAEFTGIDDGSRERSINLKLKDDKKQGYFGDVLAGGGTNDRYKASGKLYKFRPNSQFAALGMLNNINRSGFSFSDYINFSGGLQGLMSGVGNTQLNLASDGSLPVNFGQPITGLVTSGAAGINYSYEPKKNKLISINYLGNGADKQLNEKTYSRNFTSTQDYTVNSHSDENTKDITHRLNLKIRNDIDTQSQVMFNLGSNTSQNKRITNSTSVSQAQDIVFNRQTGYNRTTGNALNAASGASYTYRSSDSKHVLRLAADGNYKRTLNQTEWNNLTEFLGGTQSIVNRQFRDDRIQGYDYSGSLSWSRALGKSYYINPTVDAHWDFEHLNRKQGLPPAESVVIDTLSPDYIRGYQRLTPGILLRKATRKVQYNAALRYEYGTLTQTSDNIILPARQYNYLLPSVSWRNQYARGKHIDISYNTAVQAPGYQQLMTAPVVSSPLSLYRGNANLNPEYRHTVRAGWVLFDAFSFTSFFANVTGRYTHNKINNSITINNNLSQLVTVVNVPDDYYLQGSFQFARPIRSLGIKTELNLSEQFNKGITIVNGMNNITTSYAQELSAKIGNRKKEHWDVQVGAGIHFTDVHYSVQQSMNNSYFNTSGFAELSYKPNTHWYFMFSADVTRYNARSFQQAVTIPLLRSEISYYFIKGSRGVLTLEGFDLLNQNKGLQRISQQNYLAEIRSNIIGRYFLLSFKYRLSKMGKKGNPMMLEDIDINMH